MPAVSILQTRKHAVHTGALLDRYEATDAVASYLRSEEREPKPCATDRACVDVAKPEFEAGVVNPREEAPCKEPLRTALGDSLTHVKGSGSALPVPTMSDARSSIHGRTRGNASAAATAPASTTRAFRMR